MNVRKNLELFQELISCSQSLYLWTYSPDMQLLHTTCPDSEASGDYIFMDDQIGPLIKYSKEGHYPLVLPSFLNVLWVAAFEREKSTGELLHIHIIGPMFSGENSQQKIREKLESRNWTVHSRLMVLKHLENVPIVPSNLMFQYSIMLHYCITGEKISSSDLVYSSMYGNTDENTDAIRNVSKEHLGVWAAEQDLLNAIRTGNSDYRKAFNKSSNLSYGIKITTADALQAAKYNLITLITLCSRAAIEGGLSPALSYNLCDYYSQRVIDAGTISETSSLANILIGDYIRRVQELHIQNNISKTVQSCCDYIRTHIGEKFTIDFLAARAGYTDYYFSRKFKQETGMSLNDFIKQEKIRKAELLLSTTTMSIQDISTELSFNSRSYFSEVFQKVTGESPGEYRKRHLKI